MVCNRSRLLPWLAKVFRTHLSQRQRRAITATLPLLQRSVKHTRGGSSDPSTSVPSEVRSMHESLINPAWLAGGTSVGGFYVQSHVLVKRAVLKKDLPRNSAMNKGRSLMMQCCAGALVPPSTYPAHGQMSATKCCAGRQITPNYPLRDCGRLYGFAREPMGSLGL